EFVLEQGEGAGRHQLGEGVGLAQRLLRGEQHAVDADQDGQGRKDRQQGEEGDPAGIEHDVAAPEPLQRPPQQLRQAQGPMDRVVVERLDGGLVHGLHIAGVAALSTLKMQNGASPISGDAPHLGTAAVPKPIAAWRDGEKATTGQRGIMAENAEPSLNGCEDSVQSAPAARRASMADGAKPQSDRAASLSAPMAGGGAWIAPRVAEKRGAGAGWTTPSMVTKVSRAALCGWVAASFSPMTGPKQTSVPSISAVHSSRVLVLMTAASLDFSS